MYCSRCGQHNPPGTLYCTNCNAPLNETATSANQNAPSPYGTYAYHYSPAPTGDKSKDWAAITAFVTGILSIILCLTSYYNFLLSLAAIIFGAIGLKSNQRGLSMAGLICGILGIVLTIIFIVMIFAGISYFVANG